MKRLEVADIYPTKDAREVADRVIEKLGNNESMSEHIRIWELAYMEAGGVIRPPKRRKI